jgi:hypothetical protein
MPGTVSSTSSRYGGANRGDVFGGNHRRHRRRAPHRLFAAGGQAEAAFVAVSHRQFHFVFRQAAAALAAQASNKPAEIVRKGIRIACMVMLPSMFWS